MTVISTNDLKWLSTIEAIGEPIPEAVVVVLRHAGGKKDKAEDDVPFSEMDRTQLEQVGHRMREVMEKVGLKLSSARASDYPHTTKACEVLVKNAGYRSTVVSDKLLGNPSIFVIDEMAAGDIYNNQGHDFCVEALMKGERLPGWSVDPCVDAKKLLSHLFSSIDEDCGIGIFVSHDIVIGPLVSLCLGRPLALEELPGRMEGAVFQLNRDGSIDVRYLDYMKRTPWKLRTPEPQSSKSIQ